MSKSDLCFEVLEANEDLEAQALQLLKRDSGCSFRGCKSDALGEDERCYVIYASGEPAGFYSYRWVSSQIFYFFIAPGYRRNGLGAAVVRHLLGDLAQRGGTKVLVNVEPGAEPFWQAALIGFRHRLDFWGRLLIDSNLESWSG